VRSGADVRGKGVVTERIGEEADGDFGEGRIIEGTLIPHQPYSSNPPASLDTDVWELPSTPDHRPTSPSSSAVVTADREPGAGVYSWQGTVSADKQGAEVREVNILQAVHILQATTRILPATRSKRSSAVSWKGGMDWNDE